MEEGLVGKPYNIVNCLLKSVIPLIISYIPEKSAFPTISNNLPSASFPIQ